VELPVVDLGAEHVEGHVALLPAMSSIWDLAGEIVAGPASLHEMVEAPLLVLASEAVLEVVFEEGPEVVQ
jgi:hypothetical protein